MDIKRIAVLSVVVVASSMDKALADEPAHIHEIDRVVKKSEELLDGLAKKRHQQHKALKTKRQVCRVGTKEECRIAVESARTATAELVAGMARDYEALAGLMTDLGELLAEEGGSDSTETPSPHRRLIAGVVAQLQSEIDGTMRELELNRMVTPEQAAKHNLAKVQQHANSILAEIRDEKAKLRSVLGDGSQFGSLGSVLSSFAEIHREVATWIMALDKLEAAGAALQRLCESLGGKRNCDSDIGSVAYEALVKSAREEVVGSVRELYPMGAGAPKRIGDVPYPGQDEGSVHHFQRIP